MRIGILADIHGYVESLRVAIDRLRRERVDSFVVLGDIIYDTKNADETVALLRECNAVGVWGNHDLGLCVDPDDAVCQLYSPEVLDFFRTLSPRLEVGEFLFSHTLPSQDPCDPAAYYLEPRPHEEHALDDSFRQFTHRAILAGHFHAWFAATPAQRIPWDGEVTFRMESGERYFFVVHAVMDGWAAVLDDEQDTLTPIPLV